MYEDFGHSGSKISGTALDALELRFEVLLQGSLAVERAGRKTPAILSYYDPENPAAGHEVVCAGVTRFGPAELLTILDPQLGLQYIDRQDPRAYKPWLGIDWKMGLPPFFVLR